MSATPRSATTCLRAGRVRPGAAGPGPEPEAGTRTHLSAGDTHCAAAGLSTSPGKRCPRRRGRTSPFRARRRPVQRRGSQWPRSHMATGQGSRGALASAAASCRAQPATHAQRVGPGSEPRPSSAADPQPPAPPGTFQRCRRLGREGVQRPVPVPGPALRAAPAAPRRRRRPPAPAHRRLRPGSGRSSSARASGSGSAPAPAPGGDGGSGAAAGGGDTGAVARGAW